jgi:hypothetical protein
VVHFGLLCKSRREAKREGKNAWPNKKFRDGNMSTMRSKGASDNRRQWASASPEGAVRLCAKEVFYPVEEKEK